MIRLIIVDDEEETREALRDFIPWATMGIDIVDVASDGIEALELTQKAIPDIIITDVRMARMDGITFVTKLRESSPFTKVIFISGYADKEYLKSAIHLKAVSYVEKPINIEEIQAVVLNAVKMHLEEEKIRNTIKNTQIILSQAEHLINQDIALDLIDTQKNLQSVREKLNISNSNFLRGKIYCTFIIKIRETTVDSFGKTLGINFSNIVATILYTNYTNVLIADKGNNYFVAHLCDNINDTPAKSNYSFYTLLSRLKENLNNTADIFIGVGKYVNDLDSIKESYQTAVISLQQLFFKGYCQVAFYKESLDQPYIFDISSTEIFRDYLREGKKDLSNTFIKNLTMNLRNCSNTIIDYIKDIYFTLALQISQVANERGIEDSQNNQNEFLWKFISNKETLIEINEYLLERIDDFFKTVEYLSSKGTTVFAIKNFIQINYNKQTLTIQAIADVLHLTPAYLCQIFKKETNVTINQYITNYRIEKAKDILKDKQSKLIEIANKIGYSDANYFTRLFKKSTGITPSEYREKYLL